MIESCPAKPELVDLIEGNGDAHRLERLAAHVENCATCQRSLEELPSATPTAPTAQGTTPTLSSQDDQLLARTRQKMQSIRGEPPDQDRFPEIPGFVTEGLLGAGGQATVIRARQTRLGGRLVALKLIGAHARMLVREHLARFRTEAAAFARLEHPNIVRIYEVSEHDSLPYLVLEYVDDGTLKDKLGGKPLPPQAAAEIVETIARAVQYAHEHGVIHRDLKPRNILLTKTGVPKISDFGLARFIDSDSDFTQTNQPLGTREYMSPEQAQGKTKSIGPASDIYSLGVILFEMLTGRPPFVSADGDHVRLLQQICHDDPLSPRLLQPRIPPDLETICLKCLHKDPARRYASGAALADDLHHFQAGEAILARPITRGEKVFRWTMRHKVFSLQSAAVLMLLVTLLVALLKHSRDMGRSAAEAQYRELQYIQSQVTRLGDSPPSSIPAVLSELIRSRHEVVLPELRASFSQSKPDRKRSLAYGLAAFGQIESDFLASSISQMTTEEFSLLLDSFRKDKDSALRAINSAAAADGVDSRTKARLAIVALHLGNTSIAQDMLQTSKRADPIQRTVFIDTMSAWHGPLAELASVCDTVDDPGACSGLCLAIGGINAGDVDQRSKTLWKDVFTKWHTAAPDAGTHSASAWALRQWRLSAPSIASLPKPPSQVDWWHTPSHLTMVKVPAGGFQWMRSIPWFSKIPAKLSYDYWITDTEVTREQFERYEKQVSDYLATLNNPIETLSGKRDVDPFETRRDKARLFHDPRHPATGMTWYAAVIFCNVLSEQEGRDPCYVKTGRIEGFEVIDGASKSKKKTVWLPAWQLLKSANGYRLPIEAEWEHAARAGTHTSYAIGNDYRLLRSYDVTDTTALAPVGSNMCNAWGLFDIHGNACEWVYDATLQFFPLRNKTDPFTVPGLNAQHAVRGGYYSLSADKCIVAYRGLFDPIYASPILGFRVALSSKESPLTDSDRASMHCHLGIDWHTRGAYEKSLEEFDKALSLDPKSANTHYCRGLVLVAMNRNEEALQSFDASLLLDAVYDSAYLSRGSVLARLKRYDEALKDLDGAVELSELSRAGSRHDAFLARADVWYAKGDYDRALEDYDNAVELEPDSVSYSKRGNAWFAKKEYGKALADYDNALIKPAITETVHRFQDSRQDATLKAAVYRQRGEAKQLRGEVQAALKDYTKATEVNRHALDAYFSRGLLHSETACYSEALRDFGDVLQIDANCVAAYVQRADVLKAMGQYDQALEECGKALTVDSDYSLARVKRAQVWRAKGEIDRALAECSEALARDPHLLSAYLERADIYHGMDQYDAALAGYVQVLRLDANNSPAYVGRGKAWHAQHEFDKALAEYENAIRLDPHNASAYAYRARTWNAKGNHEAALSNLSEAIRLNPKSSELYYGQ